MSKLLNHDEIHVYLDRIAVHGCARVNRMIVAMENGDVIPEIRHLSRIQQQQVFVELKEVMQVYDSCEVDASGS